MRRVVAAIVVAWCSPAARWARIAGAQPSPLPGCGATASRARTNPIRITAELIDASTGNHVWASGSCSYLP